MIKRKITSPEERVLYGLYTVLAGLREEAADLRELSLAAKNPAMNMGIMMLVTMLNTYDKVISEIYVKRMKEYNFNKSRKRKEQSK